MNQRKRMWIAVLPTAGALLLPGGALQAQRFGTPDLRNSPYLGIGYVANIPDAITGGAVFAITPKILGGAGLYADVKFSPSSPARAPEYLSSITVDQAENLYGDMLYVQQSAWLTVDVALVYALTRELGVYAGAGYSREHHYRQYWDNSLTRGLDGFYWVSDPAASGNRINPMAGVLFRAGRYVVFQSGVGAQPRGVDAGVIFTLPL